MKLSEAVVIAAVCSGKSFSFYDNRYLIYEESIFKLLELSLIKFTELESSPIISAA